MSIRRIIFWQPFPSPHQEAFLEAVAEQFSGEVVLGVERLDLPAERVAQGWREPKHIRVRVIDVSKSENHVALASFTSSDSLHVFTGFFSHPLVWSGFRKLVSSKSRLAIYSEAPEQRALMGVIKRLRGRFLAWRWAQRFEFVLAVGGVGCEFFRRIGFQSASIVPFGYFLPPSPLLPPLDVSPDDAYRFICAGQLVPRKGIDILVDACASLPMEGWRLDIYGDGIARHRLIARAASKGLAPVITFHNTLTNNSLIKKLAAADCVVLPSRFDGWGAIVSESLGVGTPVICTTACGVATVVHNTPSLRSRTCDTTVTSLREALIAAMKAGHVTTGTRCDIHSVAQHVLSPSRAAARFLEFAERTDLHLSRN